MKEPRRICSWCGLDIGPGDPALTGDTHGVHPHCKEEQLKQLAEFLEEQKNERNDQNQKPRRI